MGREILSFASQRSVLIKQSLDRDTDGWTIKITANDGRMLVGGRADRCSTTISKRSCRDVLVSSSPSAVIVVVIARCFLIIVLPLAVYRATVVSYLANYSITDRSLSINAHTRQNLMPRWWKTMPLLFRDVTTCSDELLFEYLFPNRPLHFVVLFVCLFVCCLQFPFSYLLYISSRRTKDSFFGSSFFVSFLSKLTWCEGQFMCANIKHFICIFRVRNGFCFFINGRSIMIGRNIIIRNNYNFRVHVFGLTLKLIVLDKMSIWNFQFSWSLTFVTENKNVTLQSNLKLIYNGRGSFYVLLFDLQQLPKNRWRSSSWLICTENGFFHHQMA